MSFTYVIRPELFRAGNYTIFHISRGLCYGNGIAEYYKKMDDTRLEELKSRDVEFSSSRARERLANSEAVDSENLNNENLIEDKPYDCHGAVNLSGVMQSTVPNPYNGNGKGFSHHSMPGGLQRLYDRYVFTSRHQFRNYSTSSKNSVQYLSHLPNPQGIQGDDCERFMIWSENCLKYNTSNCEEQLQGIQSGRKSLQQIFEEQEALIKKVSSTSKGEKFYFEQNIVQLSQRDRLKRAIKEYGGTVIVFHVSISLISLGTFYVAVSSGLDLVGMLTSLGVSETFFQSQLATGASTFVIAYAVHKVFAPLRIAITLSATPFIVRHLRRIGFLKPKQKF